MISERDAVLEVVRRLADDRPVRWVDSRTSAGDFDGREWTIEVYDVAKADRRALREKLWDLFSKVRRYTGKPMSLVTHTPEDTNAFYAWVRTEPNRDTALRGRPRGHGPRAIGRDLPARLLQHTPPRRAA
ncbi:MAG: hypothetical protein HY906_17005 [Deltaproteobacteria bacterium]|nr:hypothetical protein [Deltaproteobacteria bacterium]